MQECFSLLYPNEPMDGLHDSLVDCKLQSDIIVHPYFVPFINRKQSIQPIDKIFQASVVNKWKKKIEPARPVHGNWVAKITT